MADADDSSSGVLPSRSPAGEIQGKKRRRDEQETGRSVVNLSPFDSGSREPSG